MTRKALSNILAFLGLAVALIASALQAKAAVQTLTIDARTAGDIVQQRHWRWSPSEDVGTVNAFIPVSFSN